MFLLEIITHALVYKEIMLWVRIPLRWGVLDTILCDKVCQRLVAGWWISPGTLFSSTNKTDCHDITEILLEVALNTITHNPYKEIIFLKTMKILLDWYSIPFMIHGTNSVNNIL